MVKISVIIPTYKPSGYIWECLDSICRQTFPYKDYEVIVVLNGCREPYNHQLSNYFYKHSNINWKYINIELAGVSNARNLALDNAEGEYITFIDDDDFVSESYLKELYTIANPKVIPLCYPLSFIDGTDNYCEYYVTEDYVNNKDSRFLDFKKAKHYFSGPVYKLLHRDIIGKRRFDIRFKNGEDSLFMFLISDKFDTVALTSQDAVYYRRERILSATRSEKKLMAIENRINLIKEYSKIYFANVSKYSFAFYLSRIIGAIHAIINTLK